MYNRGTRKAAPKIENDFNDKFVCFASKLSNIFQDLYIDIVNILYILFVYFPKKLNVNLMLIKILSIYVVENIIVIYFFNFVKIKNTEDLELVPEFRKASQT